LNVLIFRFKHPELETDPDSLPTFPLSNGLGGGTIGAGVGGSGGATRGSESSPDNTDNTDLRDGTSPSMYTDSHSFSMSLSVRFMRSSLRPQRPSLNGSAELDRPRGSLNEPLSPESRPTAHPHSHLRDSMTNGSSSLGSNGVPAKGPARGGANNMNLSIKELRKLDGAGMSTAGLTSRPQHDPKPHVLPPSIHAATVLGSGGGGSGGGASGAAATTAATSTTTLTTALTSTVTTSGAHEAAAPKAPLNSFALANKRLASLADQLGYSLGPVVREFNLLMTRSVSL